MIKSSFFLLFCVFVLAQGQLSKVKNVQSAPLQYQESNAVTISWQPPTNLGTNLVSDLFYDVRSCLISTNKCKSYGNITVTSQEMKDFNRDRNQFYTYHITVFGKNNEKGPEVADLIKFQDRDTCQPEFFSCEKTNQCINKTQLCDGLQSCTDNSDETSFANCKLPSTPDAIKYGKITKTSIEVIYKQLKPENRVTNYRIEVVDSVANTAATTSASHVKYSVTDKSKVIEGLKEGTSYRVRISAINPVGEGPWSEYVDLKTEGIPKVQTGIPKVTKVKITPKKLEESSAVIITWSPPAANTDAVDKYLVFYCEINKNDTCKNVVETTTRTVEITGLDKGLFYTIHIIAMDKQKKKGIEFNKAFKPLDQRTCSITEYACTKVDKCIDREIMLCNGYQDCGDNSDETADANCTSPANFPSKISIVMLQPSGFTVKFTQVHNRNRVTTYDISVEEVDTQTAFIKKKSHESLGIPDVSVKVEGLKMETKYRVRIRANNPVGSGPWSEYVPATTETFGPVLNVKLTPVEYKESSSVAITWDPPHGVDSSKFMYQVKYCRINLENTCKTTSKSSDTNIVISGLLRADIIQWEVMVFSDVPGKSIKDTYKTKQRNKCTSDEFRCTASPQCIPKKNTCNLISDCGDKSDEKIAGGCKKPTNLPTKVETKKTNDGGYEFTFTKLSNSDRVTGYNIQVLDTIKDEVVYKNFKEHNYLAAPKVTFVIDGLDKGRKYQVRFQGVNPTGDGPWSIPIEFSTMANTDDPKKEVESDSTSSGMTSAQKAGIAIGIILGLVVIVLVVVILLKQRGKKKGAASPNKYANGGKSNNGYEMDRKQ